MAKGYGQSSTEVDEYAWDLLKPEDEILAHIRTESTRRGLPLIQVGAFDGLHLEILVRLANAKKVVEIGTLGGYSAVCLCRGMGPAGKLYTFERDPHHAEVAQANLKYAGFAEQVEIKVGPAAENLASISHLAPFDLVFIDADKPSYPKYLEWATHNLRMGGAVVGDNTFAWGEIHKKHEFASDQDEAKVRALREFNEIAVRSGRFRTTIFPTAEGLTVAIKVR